MASKTSAASSGTITAGLVTCSRGRGTGSHFYAALLVLYGESRLVQWNIHTRAHECGSAAAGKTVTATIFPPRIATSRSSPT